MVIFCTIFKPNVCSIFNNKIYEIKVIKPKLNLFSLKLSKRKQEENFQIKMTQDKLYLHIHRNYTDMKTFSCLFHPKFIPHYAHKATARDTVTYLIKSSVTFSHFSQINRIAHSHKGELQKTRMEEGKNLMNNMLDATLALSARSLFFGEFSRAETDAIYMNCE
jgi:hypothetical protein